MFFRKPLSKTWLKQAESLVQYSSVFALTMDEAIDKVFSKHHVREPYPPLSSDFLFIYMVAGIGTAMLSAVHKTPSIVGRIGEDRFEDAISRGRESFRSARETVVAGRKVTLVDEKMFALLDPMKFMSAMVNFANYIDSIAEHTTDFSIGIGRWVWLNVREEIGAELPEELESEVTVLAGTAIVSAFIDYWER